MIKAKLLENFKATLNSAKNIADKAMNTSISELYIIADDLQYCYDSLIDSYHNLECSGIDTSSVSDEFSNVLANLRSVIDQYSTNC